MKKISIIILLAIALIVLSACNGNGEQNVVGEKYEMLATVKEVDDRITVEVLEAPHNNTGIFWIITGDTTSYFGKDGEKIKKGDINPGDKILITYGGQVLMSYPPQIVAYEIKKQ